MGIEAPVETSAWSAQMRAMVRNLQYEALLPAPGGLGLAAVSFLSEVKYAGDPVKVIAPAVALVLLARAVWGPCRWHCIGAASE